MNAHQLDADGVILNTIVVDSLDVFPHLVDASVGGAIGDRIVNGVVIPKPVPAPEVPQQVTRCQAKQALLLRGKLALVQPAIDAIANETQRGLMQLEWDDKQDFHRTHTAVIQIGAAIGLDADGLDDIFTFAATL